MSQEAMNRFFEEGEIVSIHGTEPFLLDDPDTVYILLLGKAELYSCNAKDGIPGGHRRFLMPVYVGQALFGVKEHGLGLALAVNAAPGSQFLKQTRSALLAMIDGEHSEEPILLLESWINSIYTAMCREIPPKNTMNVHLYETLELKPEDAIVAKEGVLWIWRDHGSLQFLGSPSSEVPEGVHYPVNNVSWLRTPDGAAVSTLPTHAYVLLDPAFESLDLFHRFVIETIAHRRDIEMETERDRLRRKEESDRQYVERSIQELASVVDMTEDLKIKETLKGAENDHLLAACRIIGSRIGISFRKRETEDKSIQSDDPLEDIVRASHIRRREVILKGEWWNRDNGPLLAFIEEDNRPVALIPVKPTEYELHDPTHKTIVTLDRKAAELLKPMAFTFYRPFPQKALKVKDILGFGLSAVSRKDLSQVVLLGIAGGILGLITPIATGVLFDTIIPEAERGALFYMTLVLVTAAITAFLFEFTQSIAMLRVEGKMDATIQAAVWDRLLALPVPFFRNFTAGDLAHRANSIHAISLMLSGAAMGTILGGFFSIFSFLLLFFYSIPLAMLAGGLVLFNVAVTIGFGYFQVRYQRKLMNMEGRMTSLVLQLINGIAKFRVTGSESRAYYLWAKDFKEQRKVEYRARMNEIFLAMFNVGFPIFTSAILFAVVATSESVGLTPGKFIAFNAAYSSFVGSMIALTTVVITVLNLVPLYERAKPIFETLPEIDEANADPGELDGEIEVQHLFFRYQQDAPYILNEVSINIKPGEFVAFVGSSGSGKSTLFRCLLGFEKPERGSIYYDGKELSTIDIRSVRKQIGVVLQNSRLMAGDIFTNICGSSAVNTIEDAWDAARSSGLEDDIRQMPMGMHTVINEGATTLSGGQRQRLLIARAIVNKPRIIFFDEATSALDNKTQAIVSRSLENLKATRIVIAHRLSTIMNADRIFVLDKGTVVQTGTYQELLGQPGLFAELAKRQLA